MKRPNEEEINVIKAGRGRKKSQVTEVLVVEPLPKERASDLIRSLDEMSKRSAEIAERFGDGLPYERRRVIEEARFFARQSAEAMFEFGLRLIQIKENEGHGDFTYIVEQELKLAARTARQIMQAAFKYMSPALNSKAAQLALLGKAKLFELMSESDDDIIELTEGGTLAGLTLSEYQRMTTREMAAALKDRDQELEGARKNISRLHAQNDALQEQLDRPYKPNADHLAQTKEQESELQELYDGLVAAESGFRRLARLADHLIEKYEDAETLDVRARQSFDYMVRQVFIAAERHNIKIDPQDAAKVDPYSKDAIEAWRRK